MLTRTTSSIRLARAALADARAGRRLDADAALAVWHGADLHELAQAAHETRLRLHPDPMVTYVVDRNINYTNICACGCRFCAFYRAPEQADDGGFVISREELDAKIAETVALGGTQILMQGGHHPGLPLTWYEDLLRHIDATHDIHIHAFSPPEIAHLAAREKLSTREVVRRLRDAGLRSIPGGGAEILVDRVRGLASPRKCNAATWLRVMREAHELGLKTTATMMFGHLETVEERIEHLAGVRALQDDTHGFTAFIPWGFQPENTALAGIRPVTAPEYLRLLALSRLYLDNVPNIQVSWVTMGGAIAQLGLFFGANDFGSTMIEENVVAAAGVSFRLSEEDIRALVRAAGFVPARRRMDYTLREAQAVEGAA